jgi:hypothetical protein
VLLLAATQGQIRAELLLETEVIPIAARE